MKIQLPLPLFGKELKDIGSKDEDRTVLQNAFITREGNLGITDGRGGLLFKTEWPVKDWCLPTEISNNLHKGKELWFEYQEGDEHATFTLWTSPTKAIIAKSVEGVPPRFEQVFDNVTGKNQVVINPQLLAKVLAAMPTETATLSMPWSDAWAGGPMHIVAHKPGDYNQHEPLDTLVEGLLMTKRGDPVSACLNTDLPYEALEKRCKDLCKGFIHTASMIVNRMHGTKGKSGEAPCFYVDHVRKAMKQVHDGTQWQDIHIKPIKVGQYLCRFKASEYSFCYWDLKHWWNTPTDDDPVKPTHWMEIEEPQNTDFGGWLD